MPLRIVKIILPENYDKQALELLESQDNLSFWQEESSGGNFVAGVLTDSGQSETIMDLFEKRFSSVAGFKLILLPVEASIPRTEIADKAKSVARQNKTQAERRKAFRISREELYSDIVDSTELSKIFVLMTIRSTVVAAIGLLKSNVAVIIGAMAIAPFLGPNVALALSTNRADEKLGLGAPKPLVHFCFLLPNEKLRKHLFA